MAKSYPMTAGDGPQSYAQNSSYPKAVLDEANRRIFDAITNKFEPKSLSNFETSNYTFRIADLGCSTGPNTFTAVDNIIRALKTKLQAQYNDVEFQVLFNDHSDNDFNTLLRSLPATRNYFAAAVPGSFYTRLFPRSSLHFVYSSSALQWLSDVPAGVSDKDSPAWNKGSVHCTGLVKPVQEAYSGQFRADFTRFLASRAEEVVTGGWVAVAMPGLPRGVASSNTTFGMYLDLLAPSLQQIADLGLIDAEKVESFNMPLYVPTAKELEGLVVEHGSFSIVKIDEMRDINHKFVAATADDDKQLVAEGVAGNMRAVFEGLIRQHFGVGDDDQTAMDRLFQCYASKLADSFHKLLDPNVKQLSILLLLKRN